MDRDRVAWRRPPGSLSSARGLGPHSGRAAGRQGGIGVEVDATGAERDTVFAVEKRLWSRLSGRVLRATACAVLVATSLEVAPAVVAAPVPQEVAPVSGPSAASLSTKPAPTEVPSRRTAYSDTYDNHDGSYTSTVSTGPINYLDPTTKTYQPIDTTLAPIANGNGRVRASHVATPVEVGAADDSSGFVSMDTGAGVIRMHLAPGVTPGMVGQKPVATGGQATVAGLIGNIDFKAVVNSVGVDTFFVLKSRPSTSSFSLALDTGGLSPSLQDDGSIQFLDTKGKLAATMVAPFAVDSDIDPNVGSGKVTTAVSYSLASSGTQWLLTVSVDPTWLTTATYPVYVDPSVIGTSQVWNNVVNNQSAYMNKSYYDAYVLTGIHEFLVGYDGNSQWATYMRFDLAAAGITGNISSVSLNLYPYHQWYTSNARTWIKEVPTSWSNASTSWNNGPFHSNPYPTADADFVGNQGQWTSGASWSGLANLTTWARAWEASPSTNYGIYLYGNQSDDHYWKRFYSSQNGSYQPHLDVTYTLPRSTPLAPVSGSWTSSRVLAWDFADPNGFTQTKYAIELATNSGFTSPLINTGTVVNAQKSYTIPTTTALTDGTTYYWEVEGYNGYGWSPWASASFRWDGTPPSWNGFTAPSAQVDQSATSYTFAWNAAGGGATIAGYAVQLQSAPVSATANVCASAWANLGAPVTVTTTSYAASSLADATCYRVGVSAKDAAGNTGSVNYSNPILRDASTPAAPVVVDDATSATNPYSSSYTIYFRPSGPRQLTLTSTGTDAISGIASSTFGVLSAPTGWTYTAGTVNGRVASKTIAWTSSAGQTTLSITTKNNAGTSSAATTLTFVPLTGAVADFTTPDEGTTSVVTPSGTVAVAWAEYQGTGGITGRSLQRQSGSPGADGLCGSTTWTNDGSPTTSVSPVTASNLVAGTCYHWIQTLTDSTGSHPFTSGAVVIDGTAPTASLAYPEAGRPLSGAVTITGVASDTHLATYTLDYGAGTSPSSWTNITTSSVGVGSQGTLGTWATGSLTGVYTLRLTVTDFAANSAVLTRTVYLDNTERGDDAYYTKIPFDLGGGWNLAVNVATGEASLARDLFSIPSYGPPQALSLAYNSADTGTAGQLGTGWSSNLTQYLTFESGFVVWHRADGGRVPFGQVAGAWTALAGHYEKLTSASGTCGQAGSTCIVTLKDQSSLTFEGSGAGRLLAMTDRFGKALTISWSTSSATATDASGRSTSIVIDATNHRLTDVTDSAGRHWGFAYTGNNLTGITDPASKTTTLSYNASNQLTSISRQRTPYGGTAQTIVWSLGYTGSQVTSVTDPIGGATSPVTSSAFTYGAGTTTVRVLRDASTPTAPIFNASSYLYDSHGYVTWSVDADGWGNTAVFDANGNVTSSSRQVNSTTWATTTSVYDGSGNPTSVTDPMGAVTVDTYNATNDVSTETKAWGTTYALETANVYDASGHLCQKIENPQGTIGCTGTLGGNADQNVDTQYTYDANNDLATETNPLSVVTLYGYDTYGDRTSVTKNYVAGQADDSTSVTTTYAFDQGTTAGKAGLVTSTTEPITTSPALSRTITYTYDVFGRQLSETKPGDASVPSQGTVTAYDEFDNQVYTATYSPADSGTAQTSTTTVYDARNRTTSASTTDATATTTTTTAYDVAGDALTVTADDGTVTTDAYDGLGQVTIEQPPGSDATTRIYDGLGDETSIVAPAPGMATTTTTRVANLDGQMTSETVDSGGRPSTTDYGIDLLGRETSSYDHTSLLATTTSYDGVGRAYQTVRGTATTTTTYDKAGQSVQVVSTSATGTTTNTSTYDGLCRIYISVNNYLANSNDPNANLTTTTTYDAAGEAVKVVDPKGVETDNTYAIDGSVVQTTVHDPKGDVTTVNTYSGGVKTSTTTTVAGVTTQTDYDGAGRVLDTIVDPNGLGLETDHAYDANGREIATRTAAKNGTTVATIAVTLTVYDSQGRVSQTIANCTDTNPGSVPGTSWASCSGAGVHDGTWNQVTSYMYDDAGNKTLETAPNGTITAYAYDNDGNMISQTADYVDGYSGSDPTINVVTGYYYDADGRKIATASPTAGGSYAITRDLYDASGNLTGEIANCTSSGTTPDSNPATCTGAGTADASTNIVTTYAYDAASNRISAISPSPANGASGTATVTTLYVYDANNRLCRVIQNASVTNPTCSSTVNGTATSDVIMAYGYDANGNLANQNGPAPEGATNYAYDDLGRLISQTDAKLNTTSWTYDAAGNKLTETDPDGQTVYWSYDSAGRLCRRTAFNAGSGPTWPSNRCADVGLSGTPAVDTHYEHDGAGNLTVAKDELSGKAITATYDGLNRPLTVSGDTTGDPGTTYTYGFDNPTRTDPSGMYGFTLDDYGRQVGLIDPLHPNNPYTWTYAASGQVAGVTDPTGNLTTNTYDPMGRLTARSTTGAVGCSTCASLTYTYNGASNIISSTSTIIGSTANGATTYSYDPLDRLTNYTPPSAIQPQVYTWNGSPDRASIKTGTAAPVAMTYTNASQLAFDSAGGTYGYDGEDRLMAMPGKTLSWDALGRLVSVSGSSNATYTYDALDRLRTVTEGGTTTRFRYVGLTNAVAQEIDNGSGAVLKNHATDMAGADLFDFSSTGTVLGYLGRNGHDDVVWTSGSTGAVNATLTYDPFGNLVASAGSGLPNDRWQSSWQDPTTGLYYVIARWYAPTQGTFVSDDPLAGDPSQPQSRDPYGYGAGDVLDRTDPLGEWSEPTSCPIGQHLAYAGSYLECVAAAPLPVPYFSQNDSKWKAIYVGTNSTKPGGCGWPFGNVGKISGEGCLITSLAMVLAYFNVSNMKPPDLGVYMRRKRLNPCSPDVKTVGRHFGLSVGMDKLPGYDTYGGISAFWRSIIYKELQAGRPMIAKINWAGNPHFVVIIGLQYNPGDLIINDPGSYKSRHPTRFFTSSGLHGRGGSYLRAYRYRLVGLDTFH